MINKIYNTMRNLYINAFRIKYINGIRYVYVYKEKYALSDTGDLIHIRKGTIRENNPDPNTGYVYWQIKEYQKNGTPKSKQLNAHRLVDRTFNGVAKRKRKIVHHIDGVKHNNAAINLIAVTEKEHGLLHAGIPLGGVPHPITILDRRSIFRKIIDYIIDYIKK